MFKIISILLIFYNASYAEIYFKKECESQIVKAINNADTSIDIAVYSINNNEILDALYEAKERVVNIRILTDRVQAFGRSSRAKLLHDIGFNIKIHSKDRIMHHKFAIFDNKKAVEGSFNWTNSAANKNSEDCNIIYDENDISILQERFQDLWLNNKKIISECYFMNMSLPKRQRSKCR